MSLIKLIALWPLVAGSVAPVESPVTAYVTSPVVELGLTSPLETLGDVESFTRDLAERLVWTVREDPERKTGGLPLRFTAVRVDRGRVAASYRSDVTGASRGLARIAESLGPEAFGAFPDVCLSPEDPPADVRAFSGSKRLDAEGLERAIAGATKSGDFAGSFGLEEPLDVESGRDVVLVLAASSANSATLVRPLILVLTRR